MKKSILSFGGIMMLLVLIFSFTEEQENIKLPDESVNLKGEVNNEKQEAGERGTYDVARLLTYLHGYIKTEVSEDYKYYENMPERKEVDWFYENFKKSLKVEANLINGCLKKLNQERLPY